MTDQTEALRACFIERPDCIHGVWDAINGDHFAEHVAAALDTPPAEGLGVERLAVAMNTAQLKPEELRLGRDLRIPAQRILNALEYALPYPTGVSINEQPIFSPAKGLDSVEREVIEWAEMVDRMDEDDFRRDVEGHLLDLRRIMVRRQGGSR